MSDTESPDQPEDEAPLQRELGTPPGPPTAAPEAETDEGKPLIEFPCDFLIKAIGVGERDFQDSVVAVFLARGYRIQDLSISQRASKAGKYISVSVEFHVTNRADLDNLYRELGKLEQVKMLL